MKREVWHPIKGYEDRYMVSDHGRVYSMVSDKVLKLNRGTHGYLIAHLYRDGQRQSYTIHRLVLNAFVYPRPEGMYACHKDGNKDNNYLSNLRYATPAENVEDSRAHGTLQARVRRNRKISLESREWIRKRYKAGGITQKRLGEMFGVTHSLISYIVLEKHVATDY